MCNPRVRWRVSRREQLEANNRADAYYAAMAGMEPKAQNVIAAKRERRPSTEPTEKQIQDAVIAYLRAHPKVAWAHRFNRGAAIRSDEHGKAYYTKFNSCPGFADIHALLKTGRAMYVEVKRPGARPTEDQASFLRASAHYGALAIVATSIEDVEAALNESL